MATVRPDRKVRPARAWRTVSLFLVLSIVAILSHQAYRINLADTRFFSGWSLLTFVSVLMLLSARKKAPFLPLGTVATWSRVHIFLGLFSGLVFLIHIGFEFPNGLQDLLLAIFFSAVFLSGIVGYFLTRYLPARISPEARASELSASRSIPLRSQYHGLVRNLAEQADELVLQSVAQWNSEIIPHLHRVHLRSYLAASGSGLRNLVSAKQGVGLQKRIANLERFASAQETEILHQLAERVGSKRELDIQYLRLSWLRAWLFVHVPLSFGLMLLAVAHMAIAYVFRGTAL